MSIVKKRKQKIESRYDELELQTNNSRTEGEQRDIGARGLSTRIRKPPVNRYSDFYGEKRFKIHS
jgi:hypothetical protein